MRARPTGLRMLGSAVRLLDTRVAAAPPKQAASIYLSTEWRQLMRRLIAERGRRCLRCGRSGCRIYGDHIVELADGGAPLDASNVQLLCGSCHTAKTAAARAERQRRPSVAP